MHATYTIRVIYLLELLCQGCQIKENAKQVHGANVPISIKGSRQTETITTEELLLPTQVLPANLYLLTDHCG